MEIRSRIGMFSVDCHYDDISPRENATLAQEKFAVSVAEKGIVLLENSEILL